MPVKVIIPTPLRPYAGKQESAELDASTVAEALGALTSRFEELHKHLFAADGRLRSFINVYVNDEDIRYLRQQETCLKEGDTISIIPSIAGGTLECGSLFTLSEVEGLPLCFLAQDAAKKK